MYVRKLTSFIFYFPNYTKWISVNEYPRHYDKPVAINNLFRFSTEARNYFSTILSPSTPPPKKTSSPMATKNIAPVLK